MRIGIDLGGTKIEGIAIADQGSERLRRRIAAPRGDYANTLAAVCGLVRDIEQATGATGTVGVGIPGTISPATGFIKNSNSTWLNGRPLAEDLSRRLDRPVRFANDANCFALSEATDGAAAGADVVFGVIVGTGARGAESPGPPCYCGRSGCVETFLSGPALARDYVNSGGASLTAQEIADRAAAGDPLADAALARYEERMARALASVINLLDPNVIVLGGGLSNIERLYERVPRLWGAHIFSDHVATRLVRAMHGDSSGVRGAAWLWDDE